MRNLLLILTLFLLSTLVFGQQSYSTKDKKAIRMFEQAAVLMKSRDFDNAKKVLYAAIERDAKFYEAYLRLASIHKLFRDEAKAKEAYERACILNPNDPQMAGALFSVGQYYRAAGNYEKGLEFFDKCLSSGTQDLALIADATKQKKDCLFSIKAMKEPLDFKPVKMDPVLNNFYSQAYPYLSADNNTMIYYVHRTSAADQWGDIMVSYKENGKWTSPVSLSENINTENDEGAPSLSAIGKVLVFAACNRPDGIGSCDLYISYLEGSEWSVPQNLGKQVNSNHWESEPTISADGRTIYFSSDRPNKYPRRNMDLYMTTKNANGVWSPAENMGDLLNTQGNETSPFVHASGSRLYFASNYHPGLGGYDIFYSDLFQGEWGDPVNIGYPINTSASDGTIFVSADGKKGYYSIYEKAGLNARNPQSWLYEFEIPEPLKMNKVSTYAKGTLYDAQTKKVIGGGFVELVNLSDGKSEASVFSDKKNGDYLVLINEGNEYAIYASAPGYLLNSINFDFKTPALFDPVSMDVYLEPIKKDATAVLNNIFFEINSWEVNEKSNTELQRLITFLLLNPQVKIEIGGHTDDVGSDAANMDLSLKRAKSVYELLLEFGAKKEQISYKGYGESKPKYANDSEEHRAKNRRIEFKIL